MRLKNIIIYTTVLVLLVSTIPLSNEMVQANNHDFCQHTRSGVFQDAESAGITNDNCNNQEIGYAEEFDLDLGTLSGFVKDLQMNPIENATVRAYFHGTYEEAYSDKNGYYHVTNIPLCYCLKNCTCSEDGFYSEWVLLAIQENTQYNFTLRPLTPCYPCVDPPNPTGGNGWYITPVNLSFIYDPEVVAHIVFRIDDESWQEYIEAYLIKDTCVHKFEYYWVNFQGEQSAAVSVPLAIDLEPPVITKNIQRIGWREFSILFEVLYDNCSGVDFVEFYLNDILQYTDDAAPFEWITFYRWKPGVQYHFTVKAYDSAGNVGILIIKNSDIHTYSYLPFFDERPFLHMLFILLNQIS